jgi:hypothetical protein
LRCLWKLVALNQFRRNVAHAVRPVINSDKISKASSFIVV